MAVVSGINVKRFQDCSSDFCSGQTVPQTALNWYQKEFSFSAGL